MSSNMNRQIEQFDVLPNFEIIGGRQLACENVGGIDFIRDLFIHTLWRQRFPHLFFVSLLPAPPGLSASIQLFRGRFDDVA